jgi:nitrate/nitrite transporter NarK
VPVSESRSPARKTAHPWLLIACLVLAGESIFMLPYMRKSYQTSMELGFGLSAFEVGTLNALYGVLAMLCYLPGGWLADRFPVRRLLVFSLTATGLGGLYMATLPGYAGLLALYAFWGMSSILTFWAALIKATRLWSPAQSQGRAFGLLDGGRGLVGALIASGGALVFGLGATPDAGLVGVILLYAGAALLAALVVWRLVPDDPAQAHATDPAGHVAPVAGSLAAVLRLRAVWLMAACIFCAYFLYLGSYEFPAYAERALGESKQVGAWLGAFRDWLRPLAAIGAGLVADRLSASRAMGWLFAALVLTYGSLAVTPGGETGLAFFAVQVASTAIAVFALRGVFYALLEEQRVPLHLTGLAVGLVSTVGYLPDVIAPVLAGGLVDAFPGSVGYRYYFGLLALLACLGWLAAQTVRKGAH